MARCKAAKTILPLVSTTLRTDQNRKNVFCNFALRISQAFVPTCSKAKQIKRVFLVAEPREFRCRKGKNRSKRKLLGKPGTPQYQEGQSPKGLRDVFAAKRPWGPPINCSNGDQRCKPTRVDLPNIPFPTENGRPQRALHRVSE